MNIFDQTKLSEWGVVDFGYTTKEIPLTIDHYNTWIDKKNHLPLSYLEGVRRDKRQSLVDYWPEFESACVFIFSYHDTHQKLQSFYEKDPSWNGLKIASFTLGFDGLDYHHRIKEHLIELGDQLKKDHFELEYKIVLDTHPVLERDLAMRAGIGWFGKNSMLINRNHGSFFLIGSILLNKKISSLSELKMETDHCGQCTRCIDACPTQAIDPMSRTIKAQDCISTFTIEEFKMETLPSPKMSLKSGFIFGCDICQDVCPWNLRIDRKNQHRDYEFKSETQNKIVDFFLKRKIKTLQDDLTTFTEGTYRRLFKNTSFERSGKRGMYKNLIFYFKQLNIFS